MLNFGFRKKNGIPNKSQLVSFMKMVNGTMTDTIGESSIVFVTGDASDLMAATFSFDSDAVTLQADSDEGGDVFFDSADSMAPIVRSGAEWYDLLNGSYCWIGPRGIAIYTTDMIAYASKIQRVLGYYYDIASRYDNTDNYNNLENYL